MTMYNFFYWWKGYFGASRALYVIPISLILSRFLSYFPSMLYFFTFLSVYPSFTAPFKFVDKRLRNQFICKINEIFSILNSNYMWTTVKR